MYICYKTKIYCYVAGIVFILLQLVSEDVSCNNSNGLKKAITQLNLMQDSKDCEPQEPIISCAKIADDFCDSLWNTKNDGNLDTKFSKFRLGTSEKSRMSNAQKMDIEALLDIQKKLPRELQKKVKKNFRKLRRLLKKEQDSRNWYRDLGLISWQIKNNIEDFAREKTLKKHPYLKGKPEENLTITEKSYFKEDLQDVENIIVRKKYSTNSKWLKVKKIFKEARSDLIEEVKELKLPEEFKKRMINKLEAVKLSLPYDDPRILNASPECNTTEINAFYTSRFNKISICAGLFNSMDSEAAIYKIISHELSHSIDPAGLAYDNFNESGVGKITNQMTNAIGATFSCSEWEKIKNEHFRQLEKISTPNWPTQKLISCLIDKSGLREFNIDNIRPVSERLSKYRIHEWATPNDFTRLASPTYGSSDNLKENEFFLRPDLINLRDNKFFNLNYIPSGIPVAEIFVQSFLCQKSNEDGANNILKMTTEERGVLFTAAIKETQQIVQAYYENKFSYCGTECDFLVGDNISRLSIENFADWLSFKGIARKIERIENIEDRILFVNEAGALFCSRSSPAKYAPELTAIEREKFSLAYHGDKRIRKLSVFTGRISKLLNCEIDPDVKKGFGSCEL